MIGYTRQDVAIKLQVSPSRVSQIAKELDIQPRWNGKEFCYIYEQLRQMQRRNKKPGPVAKKPKGRAR